MVGRTFLKRYEAIRLLGEGGMGRVYLAKQADLGRQVVVKVMHDHVANDPKFRERFQQETLVMASFQHPNVVTLYDASLNDPQGPCIVMEYIKGITVDTLLQRNGRLTAPRVGRLLYQLCEALQAAHGEGIVHRDLKPANLMVIDPDTPYETLKVMDFGLAKLIDDKMSMYHKSSETGADFAVGTPGYISPEQVRGEQMDHRSDLYSVGVILFELLTGKLPFTRAETMDVLLAHATEEAPSFETVGARGAVSAAIEKVVLRCLAKNPDDRPAGARELAELFESALFDSPESTPAATPPPPRPADSTRSTPNQAFDPNKIVHQMEAWMPDAIATYKLRGFVHDFGGEVIESLPGVIRVRLGESAQGASSSWFGFLKKAPVIDMELRLDRNNPLQQSVLHITVLMSSPDRKAPKNRAWRERCNQLFCELRGYLAGASVVS